MSALAIPFSMIFSCGMLAFPDAKMVKLPVGKISSSAGGLFALKVDGWPSAEMCIGSPAM